MTANEITDRLILDNQNLVVEELMRHDESLLDNLQNLDKNSEIMEWWLVTPYMAELLKEKGEVILSDYDCYWWDFILQRLQRMGKTVSAGNTDKNLADI